MNEVRSQIDRIDVLLIDLIAERFSYIHRASQLKRCPEEALVAWRIEDVIVKVRRRAAEQNLPTDIIEAMWRTMMDWFVNYERTRLSVRQESANVTR